MVDEQGQAVVAAPPLLGRFHEKVGDRKRQVIGVDGDCTRRCGSHRPAELGDQVLVRVGAEGRANKRELFDRSEALNLRRDHTNAIRMVS